MTAVNILLCRAFDEFMHVAKNSIVLEKVRRKRPPTRAKIEKDILLGTSGNSHHSSLRKKIENQLEIECKKRYWGKEDLKSTDMNHKSRI